MPDFNGPVTKAEAEAEIRSVKRWCRGMPLHTPEEQSDYVSRRDAAHTLKEQVAFKEELEGKLQLENLEVNTAEEAIRRINELIFSYNDTIHKSVCSYDINELLLASVWDGEDNFFNCPRCGVGHVVAVKFTLKD